VRSKSHDIFEGFRAVPNAFDPRRWPAAMTIADLMKDELRMSVHCRPCGRPVVLDPATLPLSPELPVPSLANRFKCTRCESRSTEARPEWPSHSR